MVSDDSRDRFLILAYGLLIILAPVAILGLTLGFLVLSGDLVLGRLTPLEFLELYVIELVIVVVFGYGIYRLTLWIAKYRLPPLLDAVETRESRESRTDDRESSDDANR